MDVELHKMSTDRFLEEFPDAEGEGSELHTEPEQSEEAKESRLLQLWERLLQIGLGEMVFRTGTLLTAAAVMLVAVWGLRAFLAARSQASFAPAAALAAAAPAASAESGDPLAALPELAPMPDSAISFDSGIPRLAMLHTTIPSRPRTEVITYTVVAGDTIFGIAEKFGLEPETILWGNIYTLADDPHRLQPGQVLNILPVDGVYHKWSAGEGLNGVARGYGVEPEDIINWPGNHLDPATLGDWSNPKIAPDTMLVIPGGRRAFVTWSAPLGLTRKNPAVAKIYGPGACGTIVDGAVGTGSFIWPTNNHWISGYDYSPATNHRGIDIGGSLGVAIYAADNGVIVYAGWNNWGYGNVVVIDHGNGWQTLYAHLSTYNVGCGQSVYQGDVIGAMGSTGNSSGPHLHFEIINDSYGKVNPHDFLP